MSDVIAFGARLFPRQVAVMTSACTDTAEMLHAAERAAVQNAVPERQREFATGRVCARTLLARFGIGDAVVPMAADGRPMWPQGIVGSIAHAGNVCAVAIARHTDMAALGIDIEVDRALSDDMYDFICTPAERKWLQGFEDKRRGRLATALFSAKECTYKCLSAWRSVPFEPRSITVELNLGGALRRPGETAHCLFKAEMETFVSRVPLHGTIAVRRGWIVTAMALPQRCLHSVVEPTAGADQCGIKGFEQLGRAQVCR